MEQLEVKHLAPYYSYKLMTDKGELLSMDYSRRNFKSPVVEIRMGVSQLYDTEFRVNEIKPILRPMSSMVGENGFIMFELLGLDFTTQDNDVFVSEEGRVYFEDESNFNVQHLKYETVEKLFEHHYDVFGLIEKGLAIDINSLGK